MSALASPSAGSASTPSSLAGRMEARQLPFSPQPQSMPEVHGRLHAYQQAIERQAAALNRAEGRMTALLEENAYLQERLAESGKLAAEQGMSNDKRCEELQRAFSASTQQLVSLTEDNKKLNELLQTETSRARQFQAEASNLARDLAAERARMQATTEQLQATIREHEEVKSMAANLYSSLQAERQRCSTLEADVASCRAGEAEMAKQVGTLATAATQAAHRATEAAAELRRCEEQLQASSGREAALQAALESVQSQLRLMQAQGQRQAEGEAQAEAKVRRVEEEYARRLQEVENTLTIMREERDAAVCSLQAVQQRATSDSTAVERTQGQAELHGMPGAIEVTQSTAQADVSAASAPIMVAEQDSITQLQSNLGQQGQHLASANGHDSFDFSARRELSFSAMAPAAAPVLPAAVSLDTTLQRIELARTSAQVEACRDSLARVNKELAVEQERCRALQKQVEDLKAALASQSADASSWRDACERAQARVSEVFAAAGQAQREAMLTASERLGQAEEQVSQAQQEVEAMAAQADEASQRISVLEGDVQRLQLLLVSMSQERDSALRTCDTLRAHIKEMESSMQHSAAEVQHAKAALVQLRAADAAIAEEKAATARAQAEGQVRALQSDLQARQEEVNRLKAQIQAFNDQVQTSSPAWFPGLVDALNGKPGSFVPTASRAPPLTGPYLSLSSSPLGPGWGSSTAANAFGATLPRSTSEAIHASVRGALERDLLAARNQVSAALAGSALPPGSLRVSCQQSQGASGESSGTGETSLRDSMASLRGALTSPMPLAGSSGQSFASPTYTTRARGASAVSGGSGSPTAKILADLRQELAVSRARLSAAAGMSF